MALHLFTIYVAINCPIDIIFALGIDSVILSLKVDSVILSLKVSSRLRWCLRRGPSQCWWSRALSGSSCPTAISPEQPRSAFKWRGGDDSSQYLCSSLPAGSWFSFSQWYIGRWVFILFVQSYPYTPSGDNNSPPNLADQVFYESGMYLRGSEIVCPVCRSIPASPSSSKRAYLEAVLQLMPTLTRIGHTMLSMWIPRVGRSPRL